MGKYDFDEIIDRTHSNSENVDGWRPYIFHCGPDKKFNFADDEFIRMWVADMEFAVAPEIRQAIRERVDRKIFGYSAVTDEGYYEAFERWCSDRYGMTFERRHLTFSPGVIPALYQITEDLVGQDEKVMTLTPAYGYFLHAAEYSGVEMVTCPLIRHLPGEAEHGAAEGQRTEHGLSADQNVEHGGWSIDFDRFEEICSDPALKLIYLCNPHNPTGRVWTEDELRRIAQIAEPRGIWIISDEIHCDLVRTGTSHTPMANIMPEYDRLITCMSASKSFNMAGMLFSNIIIRNDEERRRFRRRDKLSGACNPLSIEAHKAAYEKGGAWLEELKEYLDGNLEYVREFIAGRIPEAVFIMPQATYFAWVDLSRVLPDTEDLPLFFANEAGVLLEGGNELFVADAAGCIRLNLAMPRSLVETGMQRIADAIDRHSHSTEG